MDLFGKKSEENEKEIAVIQHRLYEYEILISQNKDEIKRLKTTMESIISLFKELQDYQAEPEIVKPDEATCQSTNKVKDKRKKK